MSMQSWLRPEAKPVAVLADESQRRLASAGAWCDHTIAPVSFACLDARVRLADHPPFALTP